MQISKTHVKWKANSQRNILLCEKKQIVFEFLQQIFNWYKFVTVVSVLTTKGLTLGLRPVFRSFFRQVMIFDWQLLLILMIIEGIYCDCTIDLKTSENFALHNTPGIILHFFRHLSVFFVKKSKTPNVLQNERNARTFLLKGQWYRDSNCWPVAKKARFEPDWILGCHLSVNGHEKN